jgi:hypothetical protein
MQIDTSILPYALIFPAVVIIAGLLLWYGRSKRQAHLVRLAAALGGEAVTGLMKDDHLRVNTGEGEFRIKLLPGNEDDPPLLELQFLSPLDFNLSITKETRATRALERWGVLKEVKIGDPLFDDQYLFQASDPDRGMKFLQEPGRRGAVEYFFRNGFRSVQASANGVLAHKPKYSNSDLEPMLIRAHLEQLGRLAGKQ